MRRNLRQLSKFLKMVRMSGIVFFFSGNMEFCSGYHSLHSIRLFSETNNFHFYGILAVMLRDGFAENPWFGCLIAEELEGCSENDALPKKRAVGYAIFFHTYSTWEGRSLYMEDLYVDPACRGMK